MPVSQICINESFANKKEFVTALYTFSGNNFCQFFGGIFLKGEEK